MKRMCPTCGAVRASISQTTCPRCGRQTLSVGRGIVKKGAARSAPCQKEERSNG